MRFFTDEEINAVDGIDVVTDKEVNEVSGGTETYLAYLLWKWPWPWMQNIALVSSTSGTSRPFIQYG
jgi:hypothetical protein